MQIHEKAKLIRERKKLSQEYLAHELGLSQSQYSRREKGEIPFVPNEIVKLSLLLETTISDLFGEETILKTNNENEEKMVQNFAIYKKLIKQYEKRIREKDELITLLKSQIKPNHNENH